MKLNVFTILVLSQIANGQVGTYGNTNTGEDIRHIVKQELLKAANMMIKTMKNELRLNDNGVEGVGGDNSAAIEAEPTRTKKPAPGTKQGNRTRNKAKPTPKRSQPQAGKGKAKSGNQNRNASKTVKGTKETQGSGAAAKAESGNRESNYGSANATKKPAPTKQANLYTY